MGHSGCKSGAVDPPLFSPSYCVCTTSQNELILDEQQQVTFYF